MAILSNRAGPRCAARRRPAFAAVALRRASGLLRAGLKAGLPFWLLVNLCVVGLAGCAGQSKALLANLDTVDGRLHVRNDDKEVSLSALIKYATNLSAAGIQNAINGILMDSKFDAVASSADPQLTLSANAGRSLTSPSQSGFYVGESLTWNILRYYEKLKIRPVQEQLPELHDKQREIAHRQIALAISHKYFAYVYMERQAEILKEQVAAAEKRHSLLSLQDSSLPSVALQLDQAKADLQSLSLRRQIVAAKAEISKRDLLSQCHLPEETRIVGPSKITLPEIASEYDLREYIANVLTNSPDVYVARFGEKVSAQLADIAELKRWTNLTGNLSLVGASRTLLNVTAPIQWVLSLLDQGAHNREVLQARSERINADLNLDEKVREVVNLSGESWVDLREKKLAYDTEKQKVDKERISLWQKEDQLQHGHETETNVAAERAQLSQAELSLSVREHDLVIAMIEYEMLKSNKLPSFVDAI